MKTENKRKIISAVLTISLLIVNQFGVSAAQVFSLPKLQNSATQISNNPQLYLRTELFFGLNKTDNSVVTESEWIEFLDSEVTARFPEGFTVLNGFGQYRDSKQQIIKENSRVLILLYPANKRKIVNRKIEQLRRIYKQKFQQESVLRMDFPLPGKVSF
jgi:hypothetical protein